MPKQIISPSTQFVNHGKLNDRELLLLPVGEFSSSSLSTLFEVDVDGCVSTLIAVLDVVPTAAS